MIIEAAWTRVTEATDFAIEHWRLTAIVSVVALVAIFVFGAWFAIVESAALTFLLVFWDTAVVVLEYADSEMFVSVVVGVLPSCFGPLLGGFLGFVVTRISDLYNHIGLMFIASELDETVRNLRARLDQINGAAHDLEQEYQQLERIIVGFTEKKENLDQVSTNLQSAHQTNDQINGSFEGLVQRLQGVVHGMHQRLEQAQSNEWVVARMSLADQLENQVRNNTQTLSTMQGRLQSFLQFEEKMGSVLSRLGNQADNNETLSVELQKILSEYRQRILK